MQRCAVVLSLLLAACLADQAKPLLYTGYPGYGYAGYAGLPYAGYPANYAPVTYAAPVQAAPVPALPYAAPYTTGSQFHAQDEFGNLNYGYTNLNSAKHEVGNTYGGVTGGYSYVDANGALQRVEYIADAAGFRVADSRLPVAPVYDGVAPTFNPEPLVAPTFNPALPVAPEDTKEVAEARAAHLALVAAAEAAPAEERRKREAEPAFAYGFGSFHPTAYHGYAAYPALTPALAYRGYPRLGYPYYG